MLHVTLLLSELTFVLLVLFACALIHNGASAEQQALPLWHSSLQCSWSCFCLAYYLHSLCPLSCSLLALSLQAPTKIRRAEWATRLQVYNHTTTKWEYQQDHQQNVAHLEKAGSHLPSTDLCIHSVTTYRQECTFWWWAKITCSVEKLKILNTTLRSKVKTIEVAKVRCGKLEVC